MRKWMWSPLLLAGCQDNNVSVIANKSPEVSITSPVEGGIELEGLSTELIGTVYDPDTLNEDLDIYWESSIDGVLTGELTLEHNEVRLALPAGFKAGEQTLTLVAVDPNSTSESAQVTFTAEPNTPPTVQIISPTDGDVLSEQSSQTIVAAVSDEHTPVEDLILIWESDQDGELSGEQDIIGNTITFKPEPNLTGGEHTLTLKAFDPLGDWGEDSASFSVGSTSPPVLTFTAPTGDKIYERNDEIFFEVEVDDDQVDLSAILMTWGGFVELSWVDEALPAHPSSSGVVTLSVLLDCTEQDTSSPTTLSITAYATDEDGQTGQESFFFQSYCRSTD